MNRLPRSFYTRHDVVQISKELLGKVLVTSLDGVLTAGKIVETEAYRAPDDKACHAWNNRKTNRTKIMFEEGGRAYIYICYGMHHLFNVVTAAEGNAHAVLIRAIEPLDGIEHMLRRRNFSRLKPQLSAGPGVVSSALGLRSHLTGTDMLHPESPVWIEDRGIFVPDDDIVQTIRVGVESAGESALWEWRFYVNSSPFVSKKVKDKK